MTLKIRCCLPQTCRLTGLLPLWAFFCALVLSGVFGGAGSAAAQSSPAQSSSPIREYLLQPGDGLQLSMPGLSAVSWEATIDITGQIRFPFVGQLPAAGLTLPELNRQMEIAATGLEVQVYQGGEQVVSVLSGEEVYLQVTRYRPVTVIGDIPQPGSIDYVPGLTLRALLGQAGGVRLSELAGVQAPADATVRLQSALQTQKWLRAQVLRSRILLEADISDTAVSPEDSAQLRDYLGETEAAAAISEIEISLRERQYQRDDLRERIKLTTNRVDSLEQAYQNYEQASASEEERLQRMLTMGDRGLVTADRVSEARNSALAASTRLLTVGSDIYEAKAELQRLKEELTRLDDVFRSNVLSDKRRFSQQLSEVTAQVDSLRLLLLTSSESDTTTLELLVHRGTGDKELTTQASLGDLVYPGDVVEVILRTPDTN
ncbi:polysaccharide biosynthesis/export family protein [Tritonibacter horizontis]|uniref:Polysaccharide biosynthesis/export protein n=1 Tax=Tritonibacter horizontis TaxID=1768241 RepID=A0A132BYR3_9RHOB|nr:polysaccharide biosynthesis/export family protein [Tritonibacter horizontis]KUP93521.1 polysaccharide biosynthesis/export protein [Tritonibacter horizontis]